MFHFSRKQPDTVCQRRAIRQRVRLRPARVRGGGRALHLPIRLSRRCFAMAARQCHDRVVLKVSNPATVLVDRVADLCRGNCSQIESWRMRRPGLRMEIVGVDAVGCCVIKYGHGFSVLRIWCESMALAGEPESCAIGARISAVRDCYQLDGQAVFVGRGAKRGGADERLPKRLATFPTH